MYPSTSWDFFQFHSWIFFTRASLDLKTQKSHQRRDPSILRCLWFYPHINLWEVDTCLRRRSVVPLGATDGSIHWKGFFLRWRTWCWRKNGPNILQIVQVLSLFCWELKKWCVRKWCVYSIHTYCKYHICDMCIATAAGSAIIGLIVCIWYLYQNTSKEGMPSSWITSWPPCFAKFFMSVTGSVCILSGTQGQWGRACRVFQSANFGWWDNAAHCFQIYPPGN